MTGPVYTAAMYVIPMYCIHGDT